jgi:hypothetical protein
MQTEFDGEYPATGNYFWETILFDIAALEPQLTIQTRSFNAADAERRSDELLRHVTQKMRKEKVLRKHQNKTTQPKAF